MSKILSGPFPALIYCDPRINTLLYEFVLANSSAEDLPLAPATVESPFSEELAEFGLLDVEEDSD
jgi:hypothetical protein